MEQLHDLHAIGRVRPRRRRHAAVAQRPVGARRAGADGRVLRQPAAALAHRAVPLAAVHGGVEALLPGRRSGARLRLPARHRRLLRAVPGDGEGLRRPGPRGRGAARRPPHDVPRRVDAGDGAGPRGGVPRPRAAARATTTSARSSPTACCPRADAARRGDERQAPRPRRRGDGALVADVAAALGAAGPAVDERVVRRRAHRGRRPASTTSPSSPTREAERRAELAALAPQVLDVPSLDSDVNDLGRPDGAGRPPAQR